VCRGSCGSVRPTYDTCITVTIVTKDSRKIIGKAQAVVKKSREHLDENPTLQNTTGCGKK